MWYMPAGLFARFAAMASTAAGGPDSGTAWLVAGLRIMLALGCAAAASAEDDNDGEPPGRIDPW